MSRTASGVNFGPATTHRITITPRDIDAARRTFEANESRDLFYRAATELVELALKRATSLTVAEALAVLLQTWNKARYQYRKFDSAHFDAIERLLVQYEGDLMRYRGRAIESVASVEQETISSLFKDFEVVLGPVGAAKVLHLLAPRLFPLWDRKIAKAYGLDLRAAGQNGERYWRFILIAKQQTVELLHQQSRSTNILKSIDEYNYCKFTKGWPLET